MTENNDSQSLESIIDMLSNRYDNVILNGSCSESLYNALPLLYQELIKNADDFTHQEKQQFIDAMKTLIDHIYWVQQEAEKMKNLAQQLQADWPIFANMAHNLFQIVIEKQQNGLKVNEIVAELHQMRENDFAVEQAMKEYEEEFLEDIDEKDRE